MAKKVGLLICITFLFFPAPALCLDRAEPVATLISDFGPDIISYAQNWDSIDKLAEVLEELLYNGYGEELHHLKQIVLYPGARGNMNGSYSYSIQREDNTISLGNNSTIELYHCDRFNRIEELAPTISHEYGHHFTLYHIVASEGKDVAQWADSRYAAIRDLANYPQTIYNARTDTNYSHKWDASEIAASDYVQLLGSAHAKPTVVYKDVIERLDENITDYYYSSDTFNLMPQENLALPLAADVAGLYEYWASFTFDGASACPNPPYDAAILFVETAIDTDLVKQYSISWSEATGDYEYTLVLLPSASASFPIAVKTVNTGGDMRAALGSALLTLDDDTTMGIFQEYEGEYIFMLFIRDSNNFIYAATPFVHTF